MTADSVACTDRDEDWVTVESLISALVLLLTTLAPSAATPAPPPVPAMPKAITSIVDSSSAVMLTAPVESTVELEVTRASMVSVTVLAENSKLTAAAPEPAMEVVKPRMVDSDSALRVTAPASMVEPSTSEAIVSSMTLTPSVAPTATMPVPATPRPSEPICELSSAEESKVPAVSMSD